MLAGRGVSPAVEQAGRGLGIKGHAVEGLGHGIVQLAGQAVALGNGRGLLGLPAQAGVFHGQRPPGWPMAQSSASCSGERREVRTLVP